MAKLQKCTELRDRGESARNGDKILADTPIITC
jgi:hypothetical protein